MDKLPGSSALQSGQFRQLNVDYRCMVSGSGGLTITSGPLSIPSRVTTSGGTFPATDNGKCVTYNGTGNQGFFLPPMSSGFCVELGVSTDLANTVTIDVTDGAMYGVIHQPTTGTVAVVAATRMRLVAGSSKGCTIRFRTDGNIWYVEGNATADEIISAT